MSVPSRGLFYTHVEVMIYFGGCPSGAPDAKLLTQKANKTMMYELNIGTDRAADPEQHAALISRFLHRCPREDEPGTRIYQHRHPGGVLIFFYFHFWSASRQQKCSGIFTTQRLK